jgi:hypothetical protein
MNFTKLFKKPASFWALTSGAALLLTACGPNAQEFSILPTGTSAYQGSVANNNVDILWVIDNSGSMLTKQQNLANGFDSFASVFVNKGFNFNMAIVTTDTRATGLGGQAGEFQGIPTVITPSTANFANTFKANVVVGSFGDPNAKALDAINLSLSTALLNGANTGFLRESAHLAVIILSDADDNDSTATVASTKAFLSALKPQKFDVISRTYKDNYTVSAVVVDTSNAGNAVCPAPFEDGVKFKQIASDTNGSIASICEADFSSGLDSISQRIAEAITEIPLSQAPQVATISVTFNGSTVPQGSTHGWSYSSGRNSISFHGNYIPQDNTVIAINYIPNDIIR